MRDGTIIYTDISRTEGAKRYLAMIRKYPLFLKVYKIFLIKLRGTVRQPGRKKNSDQPNKN